MQAMFGTTVMVRGAVSDAYRYFRRSLSRLTTDELDDPDDDLLGVFGSDVCDLPDPLSGVELPQMAGTVPLSRSRISLDHYEMGM